MSFLEAWSATLGHEGGYVDDPDDSGGATCYGITEAVARDAGYDGPMAELSLERGQDIARRRYWDLLRLDDIDEVSEPIAAELFDTAYNCGAGVAGRFLQRALNAFNRRQADYSDLEVDGLVGPATVRAFRAYVAKRRDGEVVMLRALNALQGTRYIELVERREKDERFIFGWFRTRVG